MIAQTDLDAMREAFPDVLRHYGINPAQSFRIPWRDDGRASGYYSDKSHLVTDYGKDERLNVFQFVGRMEGIEGFREQALKVSSILGMQLGEEESSTPTRPRAKVQRPRFEPPAKAGFPDTPIEVFREMRAELFGNDKALGYLLSRGFDKAKIWRNHLGWCPDKRALANDDGTPMFTKYEPNAPHGFIVIPFMNREASAANYAMLRTIPGEKPPESKEIRPTGYKSPLYREWLLSARCGVLYVTEGLLDCLALEMLIAKPCLGLGGSSTARIGQVLYYTPAERRPRKIVLALDADEAGRKASERIARDLDLIGTPHSTFPMLEQCKDPNDMLMLIGGEK